MFEYVSFSAVVDGVERLLREAWVSGITHAGEAFWSVAPGYGGVRTTDNAYGGVVVNDTIEEFAILLYGEEDFNRWWQRNRRRVEASLQKNYDEYLRPLLEAEEEEEEAEDDSALPLWIGD